MRKKILYQTLRNDDNPNEVEDDGPFPCRRDDAWLGHGFYFWDTFIKNAHWWGKKCKYENGYFICKAECDFDNELCFDLTGGYDPTHLEMFCNVFEFMKAKRLADNETTVSRVIEYLKSINRFQYDATKAIGHNIKSQIANEYFASISFNYTNIFKDKLFVMDMCPPIQICFYKNDCMGLKEYKIVFPEEYAEGYAV